MVTKKNKRQELSSRVTFLYKYIIPIGFLLFTVGLNIVYLIDKSILGESILPFNVLLFFTVFFLIPLIRLKKVYYDNKRLYISNYIDDDVFRLIDVMKIKRHLIYFYKIYYKQGNDLKTLIFMPHINEAVIIFIKPNSVKVFEKRLKSLQKNR